MAVLWEKSCNDSTYKVTQAGNAIRLYRNQVLHSQWNPKAPISGKIWDIFLLSSIGQQLQIQNALVLGAGGGSVINLIHYFYPEAIVDAVDLDKNQLYAAKKFFKVSDSNTHLINQNVIDWAKKKNKKKYDLIVDDVFFETNNSPFRSVDVKKQWASELLKRLTTHGNLVINFADLSEWKRDRKYIEKIALQKKYNIGVGIQNSCENRIVFLSKNCLAAKILKRQLVNAKSKPFLTCWKNGMFTYKQVMRSK